MNRRKILLLVLYGLLATAMCDPLSADKGRGGGDGGSGGGGNSGSGGGDGGNSGSGGGDDNGDSGGGDDDGDSGGDDGQERARDARSNNGATPLREILAVVRRDYPGDVIDVKFQSRNGKMVYRVKVLTGTGKMIRIRIDARSRRILGVSS
jgi:hypothetical protein